MRITHRPVRAGRRSVAIGTTLAAAVALVACSPGVPGGGGDASGDSTTATILLPDSVDSLDPALAMSTAGRQVSWLLYESLVRVDADTGEAIPGLAESWEFTPTSASFVIRPGSMCADGSEITAGTVARNFERWRDPETNAPLVNNHFGSADFSVEFDDEARTVDVELTTPLPFLGAEPSFTTLGISCDSALDDPSTLASASDGTSPYVLASYVTGSRVVLERRDDYDWGPDGFDIEELPDTLDLRILADANTQTNLLLGGDADAALLDPDQLARLTDEAGISTERASTSVTMMMFNEREGLPAQDPAVRRALAQAIDFTEVAEVQTGGLGYPADFLRSPDELCVDQSAIEAAMPTGGVSAAQQTLEEAGYARDESGTYARDGEQLQVTLLGMEFTSATVELVTAAWNDLGIAVTYDDRGTAQAADVLYSGTGWDVSFVSMQAALPTGFRPFFIGPPAPDGPNFGAISNQEYAQLQGQASEIGGLESCDLWVEAEASIVANADWVPAVANDSEWVMREGISFFADGSQIDPLTIRKG